MGVAGHRVATDLDFIAACHKFQKPSLVANHFGIAVRNVHTRMRNLEKKGVVFFVDDPRSERKPIDRNPARLSMKIESGVVIVGSDAHYMPDEVTTAHLAFVKLCRELKPKAIVMNGDAFDGGSISRWPRIGWENKPTVLMELEACRLRLGEIENAAGRTALIWPLGNHDARFETRLAAVAPEYEGVRGFTLKEHFPAWKPCWSFFVNENTVIKHRFKGGIHATHNNAIWAGRSMITGHLHSLKVTPFTDYNGTRYGIDTGCLADPDSSAFKDYVEDNPLNWRSGFAVLTFHKGRLLQPELCIVGPDGAEFRGRVL